MFQPIRTDPPPDRVRRITLVPFLTDGRCVLIDEPGDPALPSRDVLDGEHYLLDTVLRVPLQTAGFRYQRFHPFGLDRDHLYAWIEGGPYTGSRPHRTVALDCVPRARRADLVRYHLAQTVRPSTGRLLVSDYAADPAAGHPAAAETLTALGFRCAGQTSGGGRPGRPPAATAWLTAP